MSKTDYVGRITRMLISACVVPAGLGLSILHAQAAEMPGLSRNQPPCGDSTGRSTGISANPSECDCLHCREANSSGSLLPQFFKSHHAKWSERLPKKSWKYYHPCSPYFQPNFGIYPTSWTILPHDACQIHFATPPVYVDGPSPSAMELEPSTPPVPPEVKPETAPEAPPVVQPETAPEAPPVVQPETAPEAPPVVQPEVSPEAEPELQPEARPEPKPEAQPEARNEAMPSRVTPAAAATTAGNSRIRIERQAVVQAIRTSEKSKRPQTSLHQGSVARADFKRQSRQQTEVPAGPGSITSPKLTPLTDVPVPCSPARPDADGIVTNKAFEFDERTLASLFTSQHDPLFRTKPAAGSGAVSRLK